jgi:hypothetical protein
LRAEVAAVRACFERQRACYAERVAELPRFVGEVLFGDEVFGEVPAFEVAGEDQLALDGGFDDAVALAVVDLEAGDAVVAGDFEDTFVGVGDAFVLDVDDRRDPILAG